MKIKSNWLSVSLIIITVIIITFLCSLIIRYIDKEPRVAFVISHRYERGNQSYIEYYVNNIQKFYENSLVIIVDNNSDNLDDIIPQLEKYNNVKILINNTSCKYEVGAYKVGIQHMIDNNMYDKYDYIVFTQENFVIKQKYNFNEFLNNGITAASISGESEYFKRDIYNNMNKDIYTKLVAKMKIDNPEEKMSVCFCNSFVLHSSKITKFLNLTKDIIITSKSGAWDSEFWLSPILYYLNNNKITFLQREDSWKEYDWYNIDLLYDDENVDGIYFMKRLQSRW